MIGLTKSDGFVSYEELWDILAVTEFVYVVGMWDFRDDITGNKEGNTQAYSFSSCFFP